MIICRSRSFIFIHIHKCGGTSVEQALAPLLAWSDLILGSTKFGEAVNAAYNAQFGLSKHSGVADVERVCGPKLLRDSFVFATVRHPVSRLVSLYNFIGDIVLRYADRHGLTLDDLRNDFDRHRALHPPLEWPASRGFLHTSGFSQFIRSAEVKSSVAYQTQASRLRTEDGDLVAQPFKLEEIDVWAPDLSRRFGIQAPFRHANRTPRTFAAPGETSEADLRYIWEEFREDFRTLGYREALI